MASTTESVVSTRILDFFDRGSPWQRRIWSVSPLLGLREVLEAAEMTDEGVLSKAAVQYLCTEIRDLVAKDLVVAPSKQALQVVLTYLKEPAWAGVSWRALRDIVDEVSPDYLSRWARLFSDRRTNANPERAARSIAAHLLDLGYSPEHLHMWWRRNAVPGRTLAEVLGQAHAEHPVEPKEYTVLLPLNRGPRDPGSASPVWVAPTEVGVWVRTNCSTEARVGRQHGALLLRVSAHDTWGAARKAAAQFDRMAARFSVGTRRHELKSTGLAWIKGCSEPTRISARRPVGVYALEREGNLLLSPSRHDAVPLLDAALHLLRPLQEGPASSAVASGWAAIEATLVLPGDRNDRARAADLLAALVACSWPRAELTTLAYRYKQEASDDVAAAISESTTNQAAASVLVSAIQEQKLQRFRNPSDAAALRRLERVLARPGSALRDVRLHAGRALRRLYRQRNMVLHGGKIEAVALEACLRVAAPLVGAGFDRIAHAVLVLNMTPGDIAARALRRLESMSDDSSGTALVQLLE